MLPLHGIEGIGGNIRTPRKASCKTYLTFCYCAGLASQVCRTGRWCIADHQRSSICNDFP